MVGFQNAPRSILAIVVVLTAMSAPSLAKAGDVDLPERAPIPQLREPAEKPDQRSDIPLPSPRPDIGNKPEPDKAEAGPSSKPAAEKDGPKPKEQAERKEKKPAPLSAEELACRSRLRDLGVKFEERKPLSDEAGCSVPHPIAITSLGADIELKPEAVVNCALAETAARFFQQTVEPAAEQHFKQQLTTINHASAYVCRPRNGSSKLSEHAYGNALDIASFVFKDGSEVEVKAYGTSKDEGVKGNFLAQIRSAACGPFKTVLGPGTDADHSTHFHLDLAERRKGSTYCR